MLLDDLVTTTHDLRATPARNQKIERLAQTLSNLDAETLRLAVAYLSGVLPQGRIGVGWATVGALDVAAAVTHRLTLDEVDATMSAIVAEAGQGSTARRSARVEELFTRATQGEQAFLRSLLFGELRQGAKEGVVVEAVAKATTVKAAALRRALMLLGDLGEAAALARDGGAEALMAVTLTVGRPIRPMLASPAADVDAALAMTGTASVEAKLDGMRIQVHRVGDDVLVVTRSLRDVTESMPQVVGVVRALEVDAVVLDGEALAIRGDGRPAPFQDSMSASGEGDDRQLRPFFFDCLHVDGRDLLDAPLRARHAALDRVVPAAHRVGRLDDANADAGQRFANEVLAGGHEGVVVKSLDAPYAAGRRGKSWVKVKPSHTLDLVVLAVEWGSGRRQGWLSNLHLGARTDDGFVMLGKTFKGLTDDMLRWQTERLLALEVRRTKHVVHVAPELVVEVAFDGVQDSRRYPGGVALRFARVKRHRPDKSAGEADTLDTILAIRAAARA